MSIKNWWLIIAVAVVAFVAFMTWSFTEWRRHIDGEFETPGGLPECPHSWTELAQSKRQYGAALAAGALISGPITDVPEYHDCQRMVTGPGRYGPLVAVFAAARLDSVVRELDTLIANPVFLGGTRVTRAVAVAELLNLDAEPYDRLGIGPGFSCVYVYVRERVREARVVPIASSSDCPGHFDPTDPNIGTTLQVIERSTPEIKNADEYPPVARWDWDANSFSQYIGLLCGTRVWCELGAKPLTVSRADLDPSAASDGQARVRRIKGWYDEQHLDTTANTGSSEIATAPTKVIGKVFPHPDLASYNFDNAFTNGAWVTTGYIAMDTTLRQYAKKLNVRAVPGSAPLDSMNTIQMCFGTRGECGIPSSSVLPKKTCGKMNWMWSGKFPRWWARIQNSQELGSDRYAYRCVIRRTHSHSTTVLGVPGTARWRWLARDPTVWEECIQGCCEIESGFY